MSNGQIPVWRLGNAFLSAEGKSVRHTCSGEQVVIMHAKEHRRGKPVASVRAIDWHPGESTEEVFEELGYELAKVLP